jgi:hypothetical protein
VKLLKYFSLLLFTIFIYSCGSSHTVINSWVNKEASKDQTYKKIFVIALTENAAARNTVEDDFEYAISEHNFEVVKSTSVFPATFTKGSAPSKETILARVKELNCDLIFAVSLLDSKTQTRYVAGTVSYAPYPTYGYYAGFGAYYGHYTPTVYSPGYYTTDNIYYMEANLFDVKNENILWSVQTKTYNPSNLSTFSSSYCYTIIDQAYYDGLLK